MREGAQLIDEVEGGTRAETETLPESETHSHTHIMRGVTSTVICVWC
jgi:hypothetical protein